MTTVRETAVRREAELRRRAEEPDAAPMLTAPPFGDVVFGAVRRMLRRAGARWRACAHGRWWERVVAVAVAVVLVAVVCTGLIALLLVLLRDPSAIVAGTGLIFFAVAFLRSVWWGIPR